MLLCFSTGLVVIDYSDIQNPAIFGSITQQFGFRTALLVDGYLFTFQNDNLSVFEVSAQGNFSLIHTDTTPSFANWRNLAYVEPYLYVNAGENLRVYNINNNFEVEYTYGNFYSTMPYLSVSEDDLYYMANDRFSNTQRIYSVLDHLLICTLNMPDVISSMNDKIRLVGDRLYWMSWRGSGNTFYIYQINNQQATLVNQINLGLNRGVSDVIGNKVFIYETSPIEKIDVYELINDNIGLVSSFEGNIQYSRYVSHPTQYIINNNNNNSFYIRDINNSYSVLFEGPPNSIDNELIFHLNDGNFVTISYVSGRSRVHSFDVNSGEYNMLGNLNSAQSNTSNGVLTLNGNYGEYSYYYSIIDSQVTLVGSESFNRTVMYTYFYPARNKMVQVAASGIWVYDFEYTVASSDADVVKPPQNTLLLHNYPNPFNPVTTIDFTLYKGSDISIDIYNVKGQRVRSLVKGYFTKGNHQIIWDGADDDCSSVSSGVYFYRLQAGDVIEIRKMLLMK